MTGEPRSCEDRVRQGLGRSETYPHRPATVEVRETHISWIFLAGEFAYKLKKPLALDFLDYSTPQRRRTMCDEEVRLNRRLAPDIYLGTRGVALSNDGIELTAADDPQAVDFVVEMRRFDDRATLAFRLGCGQLGRAEVRHVGEMLAGFHARARRVTDSVAPVLAVEKRFERNLQELLTCVEHRTEIGRVQALERFAHGFITAHAGMFRTRASHGWVREGHGDLRVDHVLVGDADVQVVDCVEFDPALRELDVADDLAFLVFDLAAHGGERFGEVLVEAYRKAGGDPGDNSLIAFYAAYRALVRAKVALVRANQLGSQPAERAQDKASARDLIALSERFAWHARLPLLIVVCGLPASGKSSLGGVLAEMSGLPHLSSDVTRKRLAGLEAGARAPDERYTPAWNALTYAELAHRAERALGSVHGAIIDATFRHVADREAFTGALPRTVPTVFVECTAPGPVLAERATRRERDPDRISDAGVDVVRNEQSRWDPLDEVPANAHVAVRTDRPLEQVAADVLSLLDQRMQGLASDSVVFRNDVSALRGWREQEPRVASWNDP